jgi:formamidase
MVSSKTKIFGLLIIIFATVNMSYIKYGSLSAANIIMLIKQYRLLETSVVLLLSYFIFSKLSTKKIKTLVTVNAYESIEKQKNPELFHNRWHPDIPSIATMIQGETYRVECMDWTGGQIKNNDKAEDVRDADLSKVHYLSGPFDIEGAMPGDILKVELEDIGLLPKHNWGFTGVFDNSNGGGFLTDIFPNACKAIWDLDGKYATSRHIPGVKFEGIIHPGLIGTAPSHELLEDWNRREKELVDDNDDIKPDLAYLPNPSGSWLGKVQGTDSGKKIVNSAARTVPGRENGGNCDIKDLTIGSTVYLPVFVEGGKLSFGDLHFSQGDGEISFCGAIEIAGYVNLKCSVIKNGMKKYNISSATFDTFKVGPTYSKYLTFEGTSVSTVNEDGTKRKKTKQCYLNTSLSYRNACINTIEHLKNFGYTGEQAYMILSAAPCQGKISGIVDVPNSIATLYMPTEIFDVDISISNKEIEKKDRGQIPIAKPLIQGNSFNPLLKMNIK